MDTKNQDKFLKVAIITWLVTATFFFVNNNYAEWEEMSLMDLIINIIFHLFGAGIWIVGAYFISHFALSFLVSESVIEDWLNTDRSYFSIFLIQISVSIVGGGIFYYLLNTFL